MEFHRREPRAPLDRWVDHMWLVRSGPLPEPRQLLFPDGGVTVHFNFGSAPGLVDAASGEMRRFSTTWISGERDRPYLLDTPGQVRLGGIRFRPGAVFPFLGFDASGIAGQVIPLDEVWGDIAHEFHERLAGARWPDAVFDLLQSLLHRRLRRASDTECPCVEASIRVLRTARPGRPIQAIAKDMGVSHRTLLRNFDRWVGLGPKSLQRILRFQQVIEWEDSHDDIDWSRAAYACGYYDQAHLIRDFRQFTGTTPTRYRESRLPYRNYRPADR